MSDVAQNLGHLTTEEDERDDRNNRDEREDECIFSQALTGRDGDELLEAQDDSDGLG